MSTSEPLQIGLSCLAIFTHGQAQMHYHLLHAEKETSTNFYTLFVDLGCCISTLQELCALRLMRLVSGCSHQLAVLRELLVRAAVGW